MGGLCLGSGLMNWLMRRISLAKSCISRKKVWFLVVLQNEYLSHSHVNFSSGIVVW